MNAATKEAIFAAVDRKLVAVDVPEWGVTVNVRTMTGAERDQLTDYVSQRNAGGEVRTSAGFRAMVVCLSACDASGALLFAPSDIGEIQRKSSTAIERVYRASARLNALEASAVDEAKADFTQTASA